MLMVQELAEDDPNRRIQFWEQMIDNNQMSLASIDFSDVVSPSEGNHHNWAVIVIGLTITLIECQKLILSSRKNSIYGLGDLILKPVFLHGTLDGATYFTLLQEDLKPALAALFPNLFNSDLPVEKIWYQQDGAPPHYAVIVRRYLDEVFPNRWVGRRGQTEWPTRSPDLTSLDFYLWGYLKSKVYVNIM
jgi:hypothetical protein